MFHGCTVAQTAIRVEPSTVSQWYPPVDAVCEPGSTAQGTAAPLIARAATPTTVNTTFSAPPQSVVSLSIHELDISPGDLPLHKNKTQILPLNPSTTLQSTSPTFIPPSSSAIINPTDFTAATAAAQSFNPNKRAASPVPAQGKRIKRRKLRDA